MGLNLDVKASVFLGRRTACRGAMGSCAQKAVADNDAAGCGDVACNVSTGGQLHTEEWRKRVARKDAETQRGNGEPVRCEALEPRLIEPQPREGAATENVVEVLRWQVHVFDELAYLEIAQWERVIATETYLFGTYGVENELECGSIVGDAIDPEFAEIFARTSLIVDSH